MDETFWEGLLDNIFRIFSYRCVPQRNHEYLRLVPRDGDSKKPVGLPSSWRARIITRWIKENSRRVWLVILRGLDSATRQPQATAHGIHEVESLAVTQYAIPRIPLA
jgi:hypothetical protein